MNEPRKSFLLELARALTDARYPNVAGRFCAGFLWALYPDWYDKNMRNNEPNARSTR